MNQRATFDVHERCKTARNEQLRGVDVIVTMNLARPFATSEPPPAPLARGGSPRSSRRLGELLIASLTALLLSSCVATASAQESGLTDRRLESFSAAELRVLDPLLATGTVALVEFAGQGELPAIVIATEVRAPAATTAEVIANPRRYPEFMPALTGTTVESERGDQLSFSWSWNTALFTLRGASTMQKYEPPAAHPERGYRFVVRATEGDLGSGRTLWRVLPRGADRSLLISSSRIDFRDANYIARQLAAASMSMNRTANISISFAMLLRTRMEAETRAGHPPSPLAVPPGDPVRPAIDGVSLEPVLGRGDLIWIETSGADLGRIAAMGLMHTPEDVTRRAMLDPHGFTTGILVRSSCTVLEQEGDRTRFSWGIDMPLVGSSGEMQMDSAGDHAVRLDGVSGALSASRWRFETAARPYGTLVTTWGRFDPADGFWLLRVVTDADAAFRPGLASATQLMMVRGLRHRLTVGI